MRNRFDAISLAVLAIAAATPATAQDVTTAPGVAGQTQPTEQDAPIQDAAAPADAAGGSGYDGDIVVTAQKRAESAQDVPISLTALSEGSLAQASVDNVLDLPRIAPSFQATRASQAANTRLSIRGIGSSGNSSIEPSVGAFVDGIYIPRPGPLLATLNDIASVEILRGPQGTLFGRNASMGAISFHTHDPSDELSFQLSGEGGSYNRIRGAAIINAPLAEGYAVRASVLYDDFDGFGRNDITGKRFGDSRVVSLRGAFKGELAPTLTWVVKGDYQRQRGDGLTATSVVADTVTPTALANWRTRSGNQLPIVDRTYTYRNRADTDGELRDEQWGIASDLSLDLGEYTLRLLSGYRDWSYFQQEDDVTNSPAPLYGREATFDSTSHSQELQIISPPDALLDGRLSFVGGLYYFREKYRIGETVNLGSEFCSRITGRTAPANIAPCLALPQMDATRSDFTQVTESVAAFGQATFKITPEFELTGGIRYSHDNKDGDFVSILNNRFATVRAADTALGLEFDGGKFTYRANATYRPTRDLMFFATYSTGFKSGGFDAGNGATLGLNRVFEPETTDNYEVGAKTEFLQRRLTVNATLFRTDVNQFQLRSFNGQTFSVRNAGSIRQQGVEFDVTARPIDGLSIGVSGIRLDSEFTDFRNAPGLPGFGGTQDQTGARAPYSPKWQGVVSGSYTGDIPGTQLGWSLAGNLSFQSESEVGGAGDGNPQGRQPAYQVLGGRFAVTGPDDAWELYLTGENITETGYCTIRFSQVLNGPLGLNDPVTGGTVQRCVLGEPQQFRVGAKIRF